VAQDSASWIAKLLGAGLIAGVVFWLADRTLEYCFLPPTEPLLREGPISFMRFLFVWSPKSVGHARLGLLLVWVLGTVLLTAYIYRQSRTRKALERASSIIDRSPAVSFVWRRAPGSPAEFVSENAVELFGYTAKELTSDGILYDDLIHPVDLDRVIAETDQVIASKRENRVIHEPYRILTKSGEVRWVKDITYFDRTVSGDVKRCEGLVLDVTLRKEAQQQSARFLSEQVAMNELSLALGDVTQLDDLCRVLYEHVVQLMDATAFMIQLYRAETETFHFAYGIVEGSVLDVTILPVVPLEPEGKGIVSRVVREGRPIYIPDYLEALKNVTTHFLISDEGEVQDREPQEEETDVPRSALLAPMKVRGETIGVLQVQSHRPAAYTDEDLNLLAGLANIAAIDIENGRLLEEVEREAAQMTTALDGMIKALASVTESRDPYTSGHQQRVAKLACAISRRMGFPPEEIEAIRVASLLHDIGKIALPAEILNKPTAVNEIELSIIQSHPTVAFDILRPIEFPWPIADAILQHHERLDGSGYPNALKGDEISDASRIIAVADTVDAMASHRPYRAALGIPAVIEEIQQWRGVRYDARIVDTCVALLEEEGFELSS